MFFSVDNKLTSCQYWRIQLIIHTTYIHFLREVAPPNIIVTVISAVKHLTLFFTHIIHILWYFYFDKNNSQKHKGLTFTTDRNKQNPKLLILSTYFGNVFTKLKEKFRKSKVRSSRNLRTHFWTHLVSWET